MPPPQFLAVIPRRSSSSRPSFALVLNDCSSSAHRYPSLLVLLGSFHAPFTFTVCVFCLGQLHFSTTTSTSTSTTYLHFRAILKKVRPSPWAGSSFSFFCSLFGSFSQQHRVQVCLGRRILTAPQSYRCHLLARFPVAGRLHQLLRCACT